MATLSKKDLAAMFAFLAVVFLLDSIFGFFLVLGVVVFVLMLLVVLFSYSEQSKNVFGNGLVQYADIIVKVSLIIFLAGVLFQNPYLIALSFFVSMVLLLLPINGITLDLWQMKVQVLPLKPATK